jgi:hypothetical protein
MLRSPKMAPSAGSAADTMRLAEYPFSQRSDRK